PVHVDLAPDVRRALEDHEDALLFRQLDDLRRIWRRHHAGAAWRQTVAFGIVLGLVDGVVVVDRRGPRLERHPGLALRAAASAARSAFTTAKRRARCAAAAGRASSTAATALRLRRKRLALVVNEAHAH